MKTKIKKIELVQWFVDAHSNCGYNDYYGYKMSDEDFFKELMKKEKWELIGLINGHSDEGVLFITPLID